MLIWESGYKIGHADMDAEHLILFSLLNQLDTNITAGKTDECLLDVLIALGTYMNYHFAHEEALMKSFGYPDLQPHAAMHQDFMVEVSYLQEQARTDDAVKIATKARQFIRDWLISHILATDSDYAQFVQDKLEAAKK